MNELQSPNAQGPNSIPSAVPNKSQDEEAPVNNSVGSSPAESVLPRQTNFGIADRVPPGLQQTLPEFEGPVGAPKNRAVPANPLAGNIDVQNPLSGDFTAAEVNPQTGHEIIEEPKQVTFFDNRYRINPDGSIERFDKSLKKFKVISQNDREYLANIYHSAQDLPSNLIIGGATMLTGGLAEPIGALAGETAGAVSAAIGRILGTGVGTQAANQTAPRIGDHILSTVYGKDDSLLFKAAAGVTSQPPEKSTLLNMGIQAAAEAVGGVAGASAVRQAKLAEKAAQDQIKQQIEKTALQKMNDRLSTAAQFGVQLSPEQATSGIPGLEAATAKSQYLKEQLTSSAVLDGVGSQQAAELAKVNQLNATNNDQIAKYLTNIQSSLAEKAGTAPKGAMKLTDTSGIGMYKQGALDQIISKKQAQLAVDRNDVMEAARALPGNKGISVDGSVLKNFLDNAISESFGQMDNRLANGRNPDLKTMMQVMSRSGFDKKDMQTLGSVYNLANEAYADVNQSYALNQPMSSLRENPPGIQNATPYESSEGQNRLVRSRVIDFKQLSALNDRMQQVAKRVMATSSDPAAIDAVTKFSTQLTDMEDDLIAKTFTRLGQPDRGNDIVQRKKDYAGVIDSVRGLMQTARQNPSAVAKQIWESPVDQMKSVLSVLPEYNKAEVQKQVIDQLFQDSYLESNGNRKFFADSFDKVLKGNDPSKLDVLFPNEQADTLRNISKTVSMINDSNPRMANYAEKRLSMDLVALAVAGGKARAAAKTLKNLVLLDRPSAQQVLSYDFMNQLGKIEETAKKPGLITGAITAAGRKVKYIPSAVRGVNAVKNAADISSSQQDEE